MIRQTMIYERADKGTISPDQAAQELGYDAAFDPERLTDKNVAQTLGARFGARARDHVTATLAFDRSAQRYRFESSRIEIAGGSVEADNSDVVIPLKKKATA
jgi:hypothetical protein